MIFLIIGKSCAGKTLLCKYLTEQYEVKLIKQYTTREKRGKQDDEYLFVTEKDFFEKDLINVKKYNGCYYGVSLNGIEPSNYNYVLITDLKSAKMIKKSCDAKIVYIKSDLFKRSFRLIREKRSIKRIILDFFCVFDFFYADHIICNNGEKESYLYDIKKYFDKEIKCT